MEILDLNVLQRGILLVLLSLWAGLLFGGFMLGHINEDRTRRMPMWTRIGASFSLVVFAWVLWVCVYQTHHRNLVFWLAVGMTFGCLGDVFMAQLLPLKDYVLDGMGAFGMGHIAYIIGVLSAQSTYGLDNPLQLLISLILWGVIGRSLWYVMVYRGSEQTILHWVALPYALLLSSTAGVAMGLALQDVHFVLMAIGAVLFLLSDLILATELFNGARWAYIGDVVWLTYSPGQMLIVAGLFLSLLWL
jgi:hypothetical protein